MTSGSMETAYDFEGVFHCEGKIGAPKRGFCLKQKNDMWGGVSTYWNIVYLFFGDGLEFLMKKWGGNRRKWFYSEIWGNPVWGGRGACENLMDGPIETVEYIWWIFGGCLIEFCHKTAEIHFLCIELIN